MASSIGPEAQTVLAKWKQNARAVRRDTYVLYLACRDPRVPWYAKVLAGAILTYALSPIDLIPDFIPVIGYLDDLIIIPAGLVLVRRMIPAPILSEHREAAALAFDARAPRSLTGAIVIVTIWVLALVLAGCVVMRNLP